MRSQCRHILRPLKHHLTSSNISSFHPSSSSPPTHSSHHPLPSPQSMNFLVSLFAQPHSQAFKDARDELSHQLSTLKHQLLKHPHPHPHPHHPQTLHKLLRDLGFPLFSSYPDGSAFIHLLNQIRDVPLLALEVLNWRRKNGDLGFPMTPEEYAKGITVAGKAKNIDLAIELFDEAVNNRCKTAVTYNALMSVFMVNGFTDKCQLLFQEFSKDPSCRPNVVTYNILISLFGRLMLIDHMEATLQDIYSSRLIPTLYTFNNLIFGYVIAWMWDRMENTFSLMKQNGIEPTVATYRLMVRGYAHAGNVDQMEAMYELLKQHSCEDDISLVKTMISAYCKSSYGAKIEKAESLLKLVPEWKSRSWLVMLLIQVYAREKRFDRMEETIDVAFKNNVVVTSVHLMREIISAYYEQKAVDKLSRFVKRAELAEWRICRSVYHCQMVMYSSEKRLEEMEDVFQGMGRFGIDNRTKKCLIILGTAYSDWGPKCKLEQVVALMLKLGYDVCLKKFRL